MVSVSNPSHGQAYLLMLCGDAKYCVSTFCATK